MYNSRPRYTRYDSYPQAIKVPRNYSGNAFGEDFVRENIDEREVGEQKRADQYSFGFKLVSHRT